MYFILKVPYFDNEFLKENYLASKYFEDKVGLFTKFTEVTAYNQDIDSGKITDKIIIKCLYRIGFNEKDSNSYYIGKVEIKNDKVIKEFYNQRICDDKVFANKEFGKTLLRIKNVDDLVKRVTNDLKK